MRGFSGRGLRQRHRVEHRKALLCALLDEAKLSNSKSGSGAGCDYPSTLSIRRKVREVGGPNEDKRSVKGEAELIIDPATCKGCGFQFRERSRIKTPSKCPRCRGERIMPATFFIQEKKKR